MNSDALYFTVIAAGVAVAALLFAAGLKKRSLRPVYALPLMAAGLLAAFVTGKLFWFLFTGSQPLSDGIAGLIQPVPSEFSFTGCLAGTILGVWLTARLLKQPARQVLDSFALPCCVLAAFVRFAEIFQGDLGLGEMATFGLEEISDSSALSFFPLAVRDQWGQWLLAVSTLEAIGALLAGVLVLRFRAAAGSGKARLCDGMLFELSLFSLCTFPMFFEIAKIAGAVFYYVHVEQLLTALLMLVPVIGLCLRLSRSRKRAPWLPLVLFLLCVALNGFSQFFLDKAWRFSELFSEDVFSWLSDHLEQICSGVMLVSVSCAFIVYILAFRRASKAGDPGEC